MAEFRTASRSAGVSGPGSLSQRVDTGPVREFTGGDYGDATDFAQIQSGAPLASSPSGAAPAVQPPTPFSAPSAQSGVPVTDGAAMGAGRGPEAFGPLSPAVQDANFFRQYMPVLVQIADREDTPPSTRAKIRDLIKSM